MFYFVWIADSSVLKNITTAAVLKILILYLRISYRLYGQLQGKSSPPKEPNFSCPICMGLLTEETSTKCGHIFCKECISSTIAAHKKCPTCRRKLKAKDTFRIYLPTVAIWEAYFLWSLLSLPNIFDILWYAFICWKYLAFHLFNPQN